MAATMLSSMLATTLCFPSQNPNRGSGNGKSCRSSSSPAYFYPSIVRYQDGQRWPEVANQRWRLEVVTEGYPITRPPLFENISFEFWKIRMSTFLQSIDYRLWHVIQTGYYVPSRIIDGVKIEIPFADWSIT
ncbi:hypothetical protein M5K25_028169 [Dendrobium thyrsiflorum]|uniref:Uncharacterized protein n=1 Tax=Dendrobium thyrsiflorum TaxID=117978 RepID=A0ABD0TVU1_DENTH